MANPETISSGEKINKLSSEIKSLENKLIQNLPQAEKDKLNDEINLKKQELEELKEKQKKEASDQINALKQSIENGNFNKELISDCLENLGNNPDGAPFLLGMIISGLNHEGIIISTVTSNEIKLEGGDKEKTAKYEEIFNEKLKENKFSIIDFKKSLLYRTSVIDESLKDDEGNQKSDKEINNLNSDKIAYELFKKYDITDIFAKLNMEIKGPYDFSKLSENDIEDFKKHIHSKVTDNQADRDFLISFIDDNYSKVQDFDNISIKEYSDSKNEQLEYLNDKITNLDEETKLKLGLNSTNKVESLAVEFKRDPIKAFDKYKENAIIMVLGGLLALWGVKMKGVKGGILGLIGGAFMWAGAGDSKNGIGEWFSEKFQENKNKLSTSNLFKNLPEFKFGTDKENLLYNESIDNDLFLNHDSSLLNIFQEEESTNNIVKKLKTIFGDKVNIGNLDNYKELFKNILKEKKAQGGLFPIAGEKIGTFLERTSQPVQGNENENKQNQKPIVIQEEEKAQKEELIKYFNLNGSDLKNLDETLKSNDLNLNIFNILEKYKDYIENTLGNKLPEESKEKLKKSISLRVLGLSKIIKERIDWVDEEIEENDLKASDRKKEIQNQKWIINSNFNDLFEQLNNKILPSLYLYFNNPSDLNSEQKSSIKNLLKADLNDEGEFKTDLSEGIIDIFTNNWDLYDITDEDNKEIAVPSVENISLLNEKDKEIEEYATVAYALYVGSMLIPYLGLVTAIPSDTVDLCSDHEGVTYMLRKSGFIDENYRMEKGYFDTLLGGLSIGLSVFGLQSLAKAGKFKKVSEFMSKIDYSKINKVAEKMGISNENLNKILNLIGKGENKTDKIPDETISVGVKFYKNEKTGTTYTKNLEGIFYNSKGKLLKGTPRNITEVKLENEKLGVNGYRNFENYYKGIKEKTKISIAEKPIVDYRNSRGFIKYIKKTLDKSGEVNIGGDTIKKVEKGFILNGNNSTIYTKLDKAIEEVSLTSISKFKDENIIKYYLGSDKVKIVKNEKGKYELSNKGIFKVEEGKNVKLNKEETDKFLEILIKTEPQFKKLEKTVEETIDKVKNTKLKDYLEKNGKSLSKFLDKWGYKPGKDGKTNLLESGYNLTIGEFLTLPKIANQLTIFLTKSGKDRELGNLLKTIAYGDKNRTAGQGLKRLVATSGLVIFDNGINDSDDNESVDAVQYHVLGLSTHALNTFFNIIGDE